MNQTMQEQPTAKDHDHPEYSPGLEGVIAGESAICQVDEGEAGLRYRGYTIGDLAGRSSFEEVAYLLLFGHLPDGWSLAGMAVIVASGVALAWQERRRARAAIRVP